MVAHVGDDLQGDQSLGQPVRHRRDHQLVCSRAFGECGQAVGDEGCGRRRCDWMASRIAAARSGCSAASAGETSCNRRPVRRANMARRAGAARYSARSTVSAASTPAVTIVYGSSRTRRGAERLAIQGDGVERADRRADVEVMGEGVGQTQQPGRLGRVAARPEQHDLGCRQQLRRRPEAIPRPVVAPSIAEQAEQVDELVRKVLGTETLGAATQCRGGQRVGAGSPADTEVDTSRVQRLEQGKLLGDHEGGVIGQHHAARSDADAGRRGGEVGHQHRRRGAGDRRHVVMLGDPEAVVPEVLGAPREHGRLGQRGRRARTVGHHGEIENGRRHGHAVGVTIIVPGRHSRSAAHRGGTR